MKQIQHEHIFLGHGAFRDLSRKSHRSQTVQKTKSYFRRHQYSWVFQVLNGTWNEWPLISCVRIPKFKCTKMKPNTKETTLQTLCEKSYHQWLSLDFVEISTCPWHETNAIYIDAYIARIVFKSSYTVPVLFHTSSCEVCLVFEEFLNHFCIVWFEPNQVKNRSSWVFRIWCKKTRTISLMTTFKNWFIRVWVILAKRRR